LLNRTGDDAQTLACLWQQVSREHDAGAAKVPSPLATTHLTSFLYKAQTLLSGTASNYDLTTCKSASPQRGSPALCLPSFMQGILQSGVDGLVLVAIMLTYAITMFASSYVEEEHQFWYWRSAGG